MDEHTAKLVLEELLSLRAEIASLRTELREFLATPLAFAKEFGMDDKQNDGHQPPK